MYSLSAWDANVRETDSTAPDRWREAVAQVFAIPALEPSGHFLSFSDSPALQSRFSFCLIESSFLDNQSSVVSKGVFKGFGKPVGIEMVSHMTPDDARVSNSASLMPNS